MLTEVRISATVRTTDRTGVEMEALTAVAVAGLTLHDMIKAVDPAAVLDAVRVERKDGGKTGTWTRPPDHGSRPIGRRPMTGPDERAADDRAKPGPRTAVVIIASTRAATGVYPDRTGPVIVEWLTARGFEVVGPLVRADGPDVAAAVREAVGAPGAPSAPRVGAAGAGAGGGSGDHLRRHRDLAHRPDPAGHRGRAGLRDPRPGRRDPCRGQRQGADRGAVPRTGRRCRTDAGGEPARFDRRGPGRAGRARSSAGPCAGSTARRRSCSGRDVHSGRPGFDQSGDGRAA